MSQTTFLHRYFEQLKASGTKAFIPYLVAGYPDPQSTPKLLEAAAAAGASAIELGVPFSDPVADGPILQEASFKALECGMTLNKALAIVDDISKKIDVPILLMG